MQGVIWEELGDRVHTCGNGGPEEGRGLPGLWAELSLEAGALDLLARRICVCMCGGGIHLLHPSTVSSRAWRGGCIEGPDSRVGP